MENSPLPTIHVATAAHNRIETTRAFLATLAAETYPHVHLLLVDDGSTDGTGALVRKTLPSATVLGGNGRLFWGGALHMAYKWVRKHLSDRPDDIVLFTNDDVSFAPGYLATASALVQRHPNTLIAGCGYGKRTGKLLDGAVKRDFSFRRVEKAAYEPAWEDGDVCSSRSLFFRVRDFLKIGGFHPVLLPHYASDYEWTARAHRKGYRIKMCPELTYTFDEGATGDNFYGSLTVKKLFSKRSAANPVYRFSYIVLSTPFRYLPGELALQIKRYLLKKDVIRDILER